MRTRKRELTQRFREECQRLGRTADCRWPETRSEDGTPETLPAHFRRITLNHCSYCDGFMGYSSRSTIDHFLPKSQFPDFAYEWKNLYHSCDGCQRKGQKHDRTALRPDGRGYEFRRYFCYHPSGRLLVVARSERDRKRAKATIELFQLNCEELVSDRLREFRLGLALNLHPLQARMANRTNGNPALALDARPYRDWYA